MKTRDIKRTQETGSALLTAVVTFAVILLSLGSYLWMVHVQGLSVDSSQHWNAAMAYAEAGIEEAMAQLNHKFGTDSPLGANGWSKSGGGYVNPGATYHGISGARTLDGGAYTAVIVPKGNGNNPVIYSTGYTTVPISGNLLKRAVKIEVVPGSPFQVGMAAKLNINFKGNKLRVDSFNSADPLHDDPLDPNEVQDHGDVASTAGIVDVQNAEIKGKLKTGPEGTYSVGSQGSVGSLKFAGPGIEKGYYENDFNYDFRDVEPPFTSGLPPANLPSGTNLWELSGDYFLTGDAVFNTDENILVTGYTRLYVDGEFIMLGKSEVKILTGATLDLYVGGKEAVITQVNTAGDALSFSYWGLPNNEKITWSGNAEFKGSVYAPQAEFVLNGGGKDFNDYIGACVVNEVKLNGHFRFHYDENLKKKGKPISYIVSRWEEL